jgi:hypothetical protein
VYKYKCRDSASSADDSSDLRLNETGDHRSDSGGRERKNHPKN